MSTRLDPTIKVVTVTILALGGIGTLHEAIHSSAPTELYLFTTLAVAEILTAASLTLTWVEPLITEWITSHEKAL